MTRNSGLLMCAGTVAVIGVLVALWLATRDTPAAAEPTVHGSAEPGTPALPSAPTPAPATGGAARPSHTPTWLPSRAPELRKEDVRAATSAPAAEASGPSEDPDEGREYGARWLDAQATAVEPQVRECVDKAAASGIKPTGNALVTYILAYHGDKLVVEDVGVEADKSTLQQESLLDCLAQTAHAMKFVGLPRRAKAIYVRREVTVEGGTLAGNRYVSFSYLR